ncbi:tRNA 5-methylaminomethyl-2-thiouridine biosynthesis bifunctional protein MnmC [Pseudomonas hunanensis]|nr:tRNA 5-methylaminomethyl-2-thiouridine biosynthesis bifunctional protein MnmC [Pseudomonas hunanensis]
MPTLLQHAQIDWDDQGRPHSRHYDDVYFAVNEGIEETKHVFLGQTRLAERFANLAPHACTVIGETGFGTGMNFSAPGSCLTSTHTATRACTSSASRSTHSPTPTWPAQ